MKLRRMWLGGHSRACVVLFVLVITGLGAGCGRHETPVRNGTSTHHETLARSSSPPEPLVVIPEPDTTALDDHARVLVEERQRAFEEAMAADTDADTQAEAYGELGRQYFAFEFRDAALACFENAARLKPDSFRWRYYLGTLLQERGELDRAAAELRKASELEPVDLPTRLHLGRVELDRGRQEVARRIFEQVLTEHPSAAAHYHLGLIALGEKQTAVAIASLTEALRLDPAASAAHHSLGTAYRRTSDLEQARHHLQQGGPKRPRFADPLLDVLGNLVTGARVHLQQAGQARNEGNLELALAHYRKAVELDPGHAIAAYNLGATLGMMDRHAEALTYLDRAVEIDPRHRDAHFDRASALTRLNRRDEAVEAFETVLEIDPADRVARYRLALVLNVLGDKQRAEAELATLVVSDPGDVEARLRLASRLRETGRGGEAEAHYAEVLKRDPGNQAAYRGKALVLFEQERYGEGRRVLQSGLESGLEAGLPDVGLVHLLARLLATCPDPAVRDGARSLELARTLFEGQRTLEHATTVAMAFAEIGRFEEAIEWQVSLVEQAEAARLVAAQLALLRAHLDLYQKGQPVRLERGF